jgi:O-antigen/teichoic acid export membrane protein
LSLKKNVIANYLGQGWRALMGLAFVPLYIKYLGIEAYGLIGIFAILQAWLSLLDMGMKPALSLEMARFKAGAHDVRTIRNLLRSVEIIAIGVAATVALGIWAVADWLASDWLKAENLPQNVVVQAISVMGVVTALRFVENIYVSAVVGLQRQVLENILSSLMATARGLGAVFVLRAVSPTIEAFFIWQGLMSVITVALFAGAVYFTLPPSGKSARFSGALLIGSSRFAAGMTAITFLALILTQVDKILLSRLLTLKAFSYYALAGVAAGALNMLTGPITTAFYPRFVELATRRDEDALRAAYHQGAQLVSVLMGSAAIVLITFADRILLLWTGDPALTRQVAHFLPVLALGALFNGLMWMPYYLQLAHSWTTLSLKVNVVSVAILIPAIVLVVPVYGALGAAWVWVALNTGYLIFTIYFMHRRLLVADKWRWYREDVLMPLLAAAATAAILRWIYPGDSGRFVELAALVLCFVVVLIAAILAAPVIRRQLAWHTLAAIRSVLVRR